MRICSAWQRGGCGCCWGIWAALEILHRLLIWVSVTRQGHSRSVLGEKQYQCIPNYKYKKSLCSHSIYRFLMKFLMKHIMVLTLAKRHQVTAEHCGYGAVLIDSAIFTQCLTKLFTLTSLELKCIFGGFVPFGLHNMPTTLKVQFFFFL